MPTYHYRCKACEHEFEEFQSMAEDSLTKCPACKKPRLVRVISGSGLVFKGSGFYLTDYKKQGSSAADSSNEKQQASGSPSDASASTAEKGETGKQEGKESGKDSGKDPSKDSGKSSGKGSGKDAGKESGKQTGKGTPPSASSTGPSSGDKA